MKKIYIILALSWIYPAISMVYTIKSFIVFGIVDSVDVTLVVICILKIVIMLIVTYLSIARKSVWLAVLSLPMYLISSVLIYVILHYLDINTMHLDERGLRYI